MRLIYLLALTLVILLTGCRVPTASPPDWQSELYRDHPLVGKIWDSRLERWIDSATLVASLPHFQFILLGEIHDNPDHHQLQAYLLQQLTNQQRRPNVVMEMLIPSQADTYAQLPAPPATPNWDHFAQAIAWADSGWPEWSEYQPIFAHAWQAELSIHAGSLPKEALKTLAKEGRWQDYALDDLHASTPLPDALLTGLTQQLTEAHCGYFPDSYGDYLISIQRTRDALLANALLEQAQPGGALLIAGNGHIREDRAVPYYLRQRLEQPSIASVALIEVSPEQMELSDYFPEQELIPAQAIYDYIWFTPRYDDTDHCAALKQRLEAQPLPPAEAN